MSYIIVKSPIIKAIGLALTTSIIIIACGGSGENNFTSNGVGSANLTWMPPIENEDNTTLDDLAGYKIYYGTSTGNYTTVETLSNPGLSSYTVVNLLPGKYFFAVKAFDTSGNESTFSNEVSKIIV